MPSKVFLLVVGKGEVGGLKNPPDGNILGGVPVFVVSCGDKQALNGQCVESHRGRLSSGGDVMDQGNRKVEMKHYDHSSFPDPVSELYTTCDHADECKRIGDTIGSHFSRRFTFEIVDFELDKNGVSVYFAEVKQTVFSTKSESEYPGYITGVMQEVHLYYSPENTQKSTMLKDYEVEFVETGKESDPLSIEEADEIAYLLSTSTEPDDMKIYLLDFLP